MDLVISLAPYTSNSGFNPRIICLDCVFVSKRSIKYVWIFNYEFNNYEFDDKF